MVLVIFNLLPFNISLRFHRFRNGKNSWRKIRKWIINQSPNGSLPGSFASYWFLLHIHWNHPSHCCNFIDNTWNCNPGSITIFSNYCKYLATLLCYAFWRFFCHISINGSCRFIYNHLELWQAKIYFAIQKIFKVWNIGKNSKV